MFNPKNKVLNKQSRGKKIEEDEIIRLNIGLKSNSLRINLIPKRQSRVNLQELDEDTRELNNERQLILDSVIVRIMKARRTISHRDLLEEAIRQIINFNAQPNMIKRQIESLIQREYIKRDENDRSVYIYIP